MSLHKTEDTLSTDQPLTLHFHIRIWFFIFLCCFFFLYWLSSFNVNESLIECSGFFLLIFTFDLVHGNKWWMIWCSMRSIFFKEIVDVLQVFWPYPHCDKQFRSLFVIILFALIRPVKRVSRVGLLKFIFGFGLIRVGRFRVGVYKCLFKIHSFRVQVDQTVWEILKRVLYFN